MSDEPTETVPSWAKELSIGQVERILFWALGCVQDARAPVEAELSDLKNKNHELVHAHMDMTVQLSVARMDLSDLRARLLKLCDEAEHYGQQWEANRTAYVDTASLRAALGADRPETGEQQR